MREILFRGKRVGNGEWVYGSLITEKIPFGKNMVMTHIYDNGCNEILVDPRTIGQYTGLTDKNGTRIFEGDIVDIIPEDEPSVIKWDDDSARFVIINSYERDFGNYWGYELEIIGNIHDDPELLEEC